MFFQREISWWVNQYLVNSFPFITSGNDEGVSKGKGGCEAAYVEREVCPGSPYVFCDGVDLNCLQMCWSASSVFWQNSIADFFRSWLSNSTTALTVSILQQLRPLPCLFPNFSQRHNLVLVWPQTFLPLQSIVSLPCLGGRPCWWDSLLLLSVNAMISFEGSWRHTVVILCRAGQKRGP